MKKQKRGISRALKNQYKISKLWSMLFCFLIIACVAIIGSSFTATEVFSKWYIQNKPSITPPNFIFPVAWTIIYICIALSMYFAFNSIKNMHQKKVIALFFASNLIYNMFWSYFFFTLKDPFSAIIDLLLIWFSSLLLILFLWKTSKTSSILLLPYILWVSFAGILNFLYMI